MKKLFSIIVALVGMSGFAVPAHACGFSDALRDIFLRPVRCQQRPVCQAPRMICAPAPMVCVTPAYKPLPPTVVYYRSSTQQPIYYQAPVTQQAPVVYQQPAPQTSPTIVVIIVQPSASQQGQSFAPYIRPPEYCPKPVVLPRRPCSNSNQYYGR